MKKIYFTFLLFVFSALVFAQNPQADAQYLNMVKEFTLQPDGSTVYHQSHQLKLLTYYSFNRRYGETFVVFDTLFQKLTIHKNSTTMADGLVVPAPSNAHNLVLPRFAAGSVAHNHLREMVITHTALERQAVIDLDYSITTNKDFLPGLSRNELLAEDSGIDELVVRIKIPKDKELKYHLFNSDVKAVVSEAANEKVYEWTFKNVPALIREYNHPNYGEIAPRLVFSTNSNSRTAYSTLAKQLKDFSISEAFKSDSGSQAQIALDLQAKIVTDLELLRIAPEVIGFKMRTPDEVWQSMSATELEKAVFLAAALQKQGIEARTLLIAKQQQIDTTFSNLLNYSKAAVCVHTNDNQHFLLAVDDLNETDLRYRFGDHQALVFMNGSFREVQLPFPSETKNTSDLKVAFKVNTADSISGDFSFKVSGATYPYLKFANDKKQVNKGLQKIIPNCETTENPVIAAEKLEANATFASYDKTKKQDDYLFITLPENQHGIAGLHLHTLTKTRFNPFELPFKNIEENYEVSVEIPENCELVTPEKEINKETAFAKLNIKISKNGNQLTIKKHFSIDKKVISVEEYASFFEMWQLWNANSLKEVVVKKK